MTPWSKIAPGDRVELKGAEWDVVRAKHKKGRPSKITVERPGQRHIGQVDPKAKVQRISVAKAQGDDVASTEGVIDMSRARMEAATQRLEKGLGATLVGTSADGGETWSVPAPDTTTVASHLHIFHGVDVSTLAEASMLAHHAELHSTGAPQEHPHTHEREKK